MTIYLSPRKKSAVVPITDSTTQQAHASTRHNLSSAAPSGSRYSAAGPSNAAIVSPIAASQTQNFLIPISEIDKHLNAWLKEFNEHIAQINRGRSPKKQPIENPIDNDKLKLYIAQLNNSNFESECTPENITRYTQEITQLKKYDACYIHAEPKYAQWANVHHKAIENGTLKGFAQAVYSNDIDSVCNYAQYYQRHFLAHVQQASLSGQQMGDIINQIQISTTTANLFNTEIKRLFIQTLLQVKIGLHVNLPIQKKQAWIISFLENANTVLSNIKQAYQHINGNDLSGIIQYVNFAQNKLNALYNQQVLQSALFVKDTCALQEFQLGKTACLSQLPSLQFRDDHFNDLLTHAEKTYATIAESKDVKKSSSMAKFNFIASKLGFIKNAINTLNGNRLAMDLFNKRGGAPDALTNKWKDEFKFYALALKVIQIRADMAQVHEIYAMQSFLTLVQSPNAAENIRLFGNLMTKYLRPRKLDGAALPFMQQNLNVFSYYIQQLNDQIQIEQSLLMDAYQKNFQHIDIKSCLSALGQCAQNSEVIGNLHQHFNDEGNTDIALDRQFSEKFADFFNSNVDITSFIEYNDQNLQALNIGITKTLNKNWLQMPKQYSDDYKNLHFLIGRLAYGLFFLTQKKKLDILSDAVRQDKDNMLFPFIADLFTVFHGKVPTDTDMQHDALKQLQVFSLQEQKAKFG